MPDASATRLWRALRRLAPLAMPLAYVAFTLLVYWRLWTPIDGARASWRFDPRFEYWQDLIYQARTLADGQLALWNPFDRAGFPLYGDPQPGMLYPGNWPIVLWGALTGGVGYAAIGVKIIAHWVFGAIGMHLFLRRLRLPEPACYVGGLLFSFTSPKLRYAGSALNWSLAWIPWVLLAIDWFAARPSARRGVLLGSAVAMVLLAGAPAVVLYTLLLALPYGIYRMWGRLRSEWRGIAAAAGVAMLWLLPLVASNLEQLPESVRETRNLAFITDSVFSPAHLIGFAVPRLGGENPYVGVAALLCAVAVAVSRDRRRALLFWGIAAVGVLLAFGNHAGFLSASASALPPFSLFRRAHRYLYVTSAALAILAALGLGFLLTTADDERRRRLGQVLTILGGAITFALGVAYVVSVALRENPAAPRNESFGLATLAAGIYTLLIRGAIVWGPRARRACAWLVAVVLALDLWTANAKLIDAGFDPNPSTDNDDIIASLEDVERSWRVYDRGLLDFRPGTRLGIRDFGGYEDDPLGLRRYARYSRAARRSLRLLGHANVRYVLLGDRKPALGIDRSETIDHGGGVLELEEVAPAVYWVPEATSVEGVDAALAALRRFAPGTGAVVEGPTPPTGPAAEPVAGRLTTLEPNGLVAEIEAPGPGLVVISEAYYPGWRATVNGDERPIVPANALFRGVPVDEGGTLTIEMTLAPARFWWLLPFYLAALGLTGWALWPAAWRRRRSAVGDATPGTK